MEALSLAEALPKEIERVNELIKIYEDPLLKGAGHFAAAMMKVSVKEAIQVPTEQDTVKMLRSYYELKGYEV